MTRFTISLLAGAGLLSVAAGASHLKGAPGLRGLAPVGVHAQAGYHAPYVPSWQEQRLMAGVDYVPAGYVAGPVLAHTQTSWVQPQAVPVAQPVAQSVQYGGRVGGLAGLRGLSAPRAVEYSPEASRDFALDFGSRASVRTNALHTATMLDKQEGVTDMTLNLLANRATGILEPNSFYFGGQVDGGLKYQKTDVDGQFPLLSRFPFFSNGTDDEAGVFAIDQASLALTSTFGDWTTVYLQPEYSETEFAGDQDEFQLRKAFVVLGDLNRTPFYAAFGRKTIDFGNFDSYNAFTQNEGQHFFWSVADQPVLELGYYKDGLKLSASALSGGRQLRVAFADEQNNIANYAASVEKEFLLGGDRAFTVGGGYLHDTIYRDNFTSHTFQGRQNGTPPANLINGRNSAVNAYAEYNSGFLDAMVEYTTTLEPWAAAIPATPDGTPLPQFLIDPAGSTTDFDNINFDQNLEVLVAQLRVKPMVMGRPLAVALSSSWGEIGDEFETISPLTGNELSWEDNQQHAFSLEYPISRHLDIGAEYVFNRGFIPFVAPQLVSNEETEAHAINVGIKARF